MEWLPFSYSFFIYASYKNQQMGEKLTSMMPTPAVSLHKTIVCEPLAVRRVLLLIIHVIHESVDILPVLLWSRNKVYELVGLIFYQTTPIKLLTLCTILVLKINMVKYMYNIQYVTWLLMSNFKLITNTK